MPAKIKLPALLKERLAEATHEPAVRKALREFGNWFGESKQTFFPDYTNHGIEHIEQVLETAVNLIPKKKKALAAFSKDDAAALILAVLLHDSALHLSKAGFYTLIKGPVSYAHLPFFDRADWGQTWTDFMFLARRWDDTTLANVFGTDASGAPRAQVRDPFEHWHNLTETDELLIGEFIRKHHPRLAHEMALYGVPGVNGTYLHLNDLPLAWRDLVGLIARSHGLQLRSGLEYLKNTPHFGTFAHRDYKTVHAVYLMALLRVGDYIQIQGDRTSELVFQFKDIPSLLSRVEHKAHLSDITITDATDDPESLQIDAHPQEVAIFLRLKEWLAGIQQELDGSWAVLGEVYGLQPKLKYLGLTFRRVRSNLDNVAEFAKTVPYVPDRIRFDVARAELLKLLIGPLYGDDPSYGVRELMQNAIDAVREYDQFVLDNPQYASVPRREQEADVVVELGPLDEATGYATMTISDRGIGMTEATIRDYFLRAGASYRRSAEWKNYFEDDTSIGAKSKVLRSGRFGIGALAAFLIGDEITVSSRHIGTSEGYLFTTQVTAESIQVVKKIYLKVGTVISIKVNSRVYEELFSSVEMIKRPKRWDWYCGAYPSIVRCVPSRNKKIISNKLSNKYSALDVKWRYLPADLPYKVYWTFDKAPLLTCNNIFINNSKSARSASQIVGRLEGLSIDVDHSCISIIDADGTFPLNLQRDGLREEGYVFDELLSRDILTESLAWLFLNGPNKPGNAINEIHEYKNSISLIMNAALISNANGYGITLSVLLNSYPVRHLILQPNVGIIASLYSADYLFISAPLESRNQKFFANLSVVGNGGNKISLRQVLYYDKINVMPIGIIYQEINYNKNILEFAVESHIGQWLVVSSKECVISEIEIGKFPNVPMSNSFWHLPIRNVSYSSGNGGAKRRVQMRLALEESFYEAGSYLSSSPPWLLDELWLEHFGREWIPFDLKERIAKFPKAAKFFAERYPQVVPDEAWALLGGKPAPA